MDIYIREYNYPINLIPELNIWDIIISSMEIPTLSNFVRTFPLMCIGKNHINLPEYIGRFNIDDILDINYSSREYGVATQLEKLSIPVYQYTDMDTPIQWLLEGIHIFINNHRLFYVSKGDLIEINHMDVTVDDIIIPINHLFFISVMKTYHDITDKFLALLQEKFNPQTRYRTIDKFLSVSMM